jgi:hypothetical protein
MPFTENHFPEFFNASAPTIDMTKIKTNDTTDHPALAVGPLCLKICTSFSSKVWFRIMQALRAAIEQPDYASFSSVFR